MKCSWHLPMFLYKTRVGAVGQNLWNQNNFCVPVSHPRVSFALMALAVLTWPVLQKGSLWVHCCYLKFSCVSCCRAVEYSKGEGKKGRLILFNRQWWFLAQQHVLHDAIYGCLMPETIFMSNYTSWLRKIFFQHVTTFKSLFHSTAICCFKPC